MHAHSEAGVKKKLKLAAAHTHIHWASHASQAGNISNSHVKKEQ